MDVRESTALGASVAFGERMIEIPAYLCHPVLIVDIDDHCTGYDADPAEAPDRTDCIHCDPPEIRLD
jgi:hypothetical protein